MKNMRRISMKRLTGILILFLALASLKAQVEFTEVVTREDMEAAQKRADDGMLFLFVDVYATWCGPCKMMDRDVYTNPAVAEYMNTHFVNVKMDGETDFGRNYAARQQLQGYPSMFIFSDDGERISSMVGYRAPENMVGELKTVVDNYTTVKRFGAEYEKGTLSAEDFADYISRLREMGNGEKAEELAGEYIKSQLGETLDRADILVVAPYTDLEDPWWSQMVLHPEKVKDALGSKYLENLENIYNNSLVKAIRQNDIDLISRMANELAPLVEEEQTESRDLRTLPFLQYYYYTGRQEELIAYVEQRYASDRMGDYRWLFGTASQIVDMDQRYQTPEIMEKGEEWFAECLKHEEAYDYYFYYGISQLFQKKPEQAKESFNHAAALASTDEEKQMVDQVLRYIEQPPEH
jgi:thioredoxin-related protein